MRIHPTTAAVLAAVTILCTARASGDDARESVRSQFPTGCTPEAQRCLDKLATQFDRTQPLQHSIRTERAIRALVESDPECAMVLWAAGL